MKNQITGQQVFFQPFKGIGRCLHKWISSIAYRKKLLFLSADYGYSNIQNFIQLINEAFFRQFCSHARKMQCILNKGRNFGASLTDTVQKVKFSFMNLFSKCDQIRRFLLFWSHLLKKYLTENFSFLYGVTPVGDPWLFCNVTPNFFEHDHGSIYNLAEFKLHAYNFSS